MSFEVGLNTAAVIDATGHVALCEIVSPALVLLLALRHQREEDYH